MTDDGVRAPELPDYLQWVNTRLPPSIASCKGKVVLLYFWTYSNINCLTLLPEVRGLENKYENGLVVVGIHCPKFPHERETTHVLKAVNRLFIRHPIAVDNDFLLWRQYGVTAWPTVAVIDADGRLRDVLRGDAVARALDTLIGKLLDEATKNNLRHYGRVRVARQPEEPASLQFPTAVVHARGNLYLSDSGNNRILEIKENGRIQRTFGSGNPGFWDGNQEQAGFNAPRGLAVDENHLFIADCGNHAIRRINLFNGDVETLVGTGKPGKMMVRSSRALREITLMSPVDLVANGPDIYISMAGLNQIWHLDLKNSTVGWLCGTGQAAVADGNATSTAFAYPQGLAMLGSLLYVADSDGSAIREVHCQNRMTSTLIGQAPFAFGNVNGTIENARLQYPMALAAREGSHELWIADSFNDCIRVLNLESGELSTPQIDYPFSEPFDMCMDHDVLWVVNTNAHELVRINTTNFQCEAIEIVAPRF